MSLKKLDKKIINFAYPLQQKPGFVKRKSLLSYMGINEQQLDKSVDCLILHGYIIVTKKKTGHNGICYELTNKGLLMWEDLNKPILEKIHSNLKTTSIIVILVFFISYLLNLFSIEIKESLTNVFS